MTTFDIWLEGYALNGQRDVARYVGHAEGDTFPAACQSFVDAHPYEFPRDLYDAERNAYWGSRFFDNEREARAAFG